MVPDMNTEGAPRVGQTAAGALPMHACQRAKIEGSP